MHESLTPHDEHDLRLQAQVHPADWVNPTPSGRYNLVVIGAGTAGLVAAAGAAALGAKVALVEKHLMGGDCLNVGCVPSKAMIRSARAAAAVRGAGEFGVRVPPDVQVDFAAAMERMRRVRASIAPHDSARRFAEMGVDVFLGEARFTGRDTVEVTPCPPVAAGLPTAPQHPPPPPPPLRTPAGSETSAIADAAESGDPRRTLEPRQTLTFRKAVIATGSRPAMPPVPGLEEVDALTNESVFSLTELPRRLAIIGAGPIGCELAQAFARLGAEVRLIEAGHGVLPRDDRDAAEIVQRAMTADGVQLLCCGTEMRIARTGGVIGLSLRSHGQQHEFAVDRLLVAAGRTPNVEGLGLENAGVNYDLQRGVEVNERLQTSNRRIYAAGDVCSPYRFTHAADFMARLVVQNALFFGRRKSSALTIPWCTYTSPELAHVGLSAEDARREGKPIDTYTIPLAEVDRAVLEGEAGGFVRIHTARGSDRIVGATIVAANAGELIAEVVLAMTGKLGLKHIAGTIHPYPTQAEAIRRAGDLYNRGRLTPGVKRVLQTWLRWTR